MTGPGGEASLCLPGADSEWLLVTLGATWVAAVLLLVLLGVMRWRQRPPPSQRPRRHISHVIPTQAVTVTEIRARLQREAAFAGQARVITVRPRQPRPPPR